MGLGLACQNDIEPHPQAMQHAVDLQKTAASQVDKIPKERVQHSLETLADEDITGRGTRTV